MTIALQRSTRHTMPGTGSSRNMTVDNSAKQWTVLSINMIRGLSSMSFQERYVINFLIEENTHQPTIILRVSIEIIFAVFFKPFTNFVAIVGLLIFRVYLMPTI